MAIAFVVEMPGVAQAQINQATEKLGISESTPPDGLIVHIEATADDGSRVIDVWESEEAFGRFMEKLGPVLAEVGVPEFPPPPMLQVQSVLFGRGKK